MLSNVLQQGAVVTAAANVDLPTFWKVCTKLTGPLLTILPRALKENLGILAVQVAG